MCLPAWWVPAVLEVVWKENTNCLSFLEWFDSWSGWVDVFQLFFFFFLKILCLLSICLSWVKLLSQQFYCFSYLLKFTTVRVSSHNISFWLSWAQALTGLWVGESAVFWFSNLSTACLFTLYNRCIYMYWVVWVLHYFIYTYIYIYK